MKKTILTLLTAATVGFATLATPSSAEAHWRRGGFGPGLAGGLIAGALIGGLARPAYAYGPAYGYYDDYAPVAYGSYGYAPAYYGGYTTTYYQRAYYGPRYRRVIRPAFAYYAGPRYHRWHGHRRHHW
jgi:hypothetical protein